MFIFHSPPQPQQHSSPCRVASSADSSHRPSATAAPPLSPSAVLLHLRTFTVFFSFPPQHLKHRASHLITSQQCGHAPATSFVAIDLRRCRTAQAAPAAVALAVSPPLRLRLLSSAFAPLRDKLSLVHVKSPSACLSSAPGHVPSSIIAVHRSDLGVIVQLCTRHPADPHSAVSFDLSCRD